MLALAAVVVFFIALITAAVWDVIFQEIPNLAPVGVVGAFIVFAITEPLGIWTVISHVTVGMATLGAFSVFFLRGWMGGGDVKLIAASAVWFGTQGVFPYLLTMAFVGGGFALFIIVVRFLVPKGLQFRSTWLQRFVLPGEGIPYGVAIALACLGALPYLPSAGLETLN